MAKGLALLLGSPKGKGSMFDSKFGSKSDEDEDTGPDSSEYGDEETENLKVLFPDAADEDLPDMLEAFKALFKACEKQPHEEAEDDTE